MFWISVQIIDFIVNNKLTFLLVVWLLGMFNYALMTYYYRKYKPIQNTFRVPVTVVVPTFREKPELFKKCLESIKIQLKETDEFFIVFDEENISLQAIAEPYGTVMVKGKVRGGKRSALAYGCDRAHNPIIVTIDSDTILCKDCLDTIVMPFENEKMGAVSAYQRIFDADMNMASKFADYNELMAHGFIQKATSAAGNVAVLFGRCLAIRKDVWGQISTKYQTRTFLGRKVESGDDNDITLLTIQAGYQTFMQSTAKITTDCPRSFWKRLIQQHRFSTSSMRVTYMDWSKPELINRAKLGFINQMSAVVFPFLILGVWIEWVYHIIYGNVSIITLSTPLLIITTIGTLSSTLFLHHLTELEHKKDIPIWIIYVFYSWLILTVLNIISALSIFKEHHEMAQYSRNG